MNSENNTQTAQSFQNTMSEQWRQSMQSLQQFNSPVFGMLSGSKIKIPPEKLETLRKQYMQEAAALWSRCAQPDAVLKDKRFSAQAWKESPLAAFPAAAYLLNSRTLQNLVDVIEADEKTRARIRFAVDQWVAATSPSNSLAFNLDAQRKAIESRGESIAKGISLMLQDIRQGYVSQTEERFFEVGRNVATSEGAVIFENELIQLIEYKPLTEKVYALPLLIVPPCINKFYILDLQPENSLVRYAVEQGHHTFIVSWRNPDESLAQKTWDDYIEDGILKAIAVTREVTEAKTINALGFCVGGTMLGTALAVLAERGEKSVESATFLTTFLDFKDTGILDIFIDDYFIKYREKQFENGGLLKGQELASTFSFLRPNELVWNYVEGNYLKGQMPPVFDLLYWNSDSTNLPGPFYAWYLRNTYLENNLIKPGKLTVCGSKIDLRKIKIPVYIYGSREDHIVPVGENGGGAYGSTQHLTGEKRFVMGASGHIAGVINPPAKNKRSHWIRKDGKLPATQKQWFEGAQEHQGSWWPDWSAWLQPYAGKQIKAPADYGNGKYKKIEPAPGRYVKQKANAKN